MTDETREQSIAAVMGKGRKQGILEHAFCLDNEAHVIGWLSEYEANAAITRALDRERKRTLQAVGCRRPFGTGRLTCYERGLSSDQRCDLCRMLSEVRERMERP